METEKIREQNQQHAAAVSREQEQVKELLRRGSIRHYFLGPENIWSQEGFGTVMGGAFTAILGGIILPKLILYSNSSLALDYVCWIMTAIGILVCGKGFYRMRKEARIENKPVPDKVHDEILEYDMAGLKEISKRVLKENIPKLREEESLDGMEMVLVKGPRDYVANSNLPLIWKLGEDGKLRYSNFSVMALFFGKENLYLFTSIFNMRNGTSKFQHTYECPYQKIRFAGFQNETVETPNQQNKAVQRNLRMLVIDAGDGENDKLSMPVTDYDIVKKLNGTIDNSDAEEAVRILTEKRKTTINFEINSD